MHAGVDAMNPTVDLLDPELYRTDPHDLWTQLRAVDGLSRDERNGLIAVTRHADIVEVERRSAVFSSKQGYRAIWDSNESNTISLDDPAHRERRAVVQHQFTRSGVTAHEALITSLIDGMLGEIESLSEFDVIDQLAAQLSARVTCHLLGLPDDRWRDLKRWSEQLMRVDMRDRDPDAFSGFVDANRDLRTVIAELESELRVCPRDGLLSIWLNSEMSNGRPLPPHAVLHEMGLFVAGGAETTRTVIALGLRAFCANTDQWELLARETRLVPSAVEEMFRWVTPLNNMFRRANADTELAGTPIRRGERLILLYPSANRDEGVFDDPFRFDVTRTPNPHLAFGFGTHLCLGANLARLELRLLIAAMVERFTDLSVVTEPDVEPNIHARAVRSFRMRVARR